MKTRITFFISFLLLAILTISVALPANGANAAPPAQGFVTATPGADGRILYTVVSGDSCSSVAFQHGITVPQLRQYNTRLDEDCTLSIGQQIVVGLAQAPGPTAGPAPTLAPPTPTATPFNGRTEVCVLLFDDFNGDALRQDTEFGIDGGAVSRGGDMAKRKSTRSQTKQHRSCGTMAAHMMLLERYPAFRARQMRLEGATDRRRATGEDLKKARVVTIKTVVNVVYNTAEQNISDAQIKTQIKAMNKDFRATNPDKSHPRSPSRASSRIRACSSSWSR